MWRGGRVEMRRNGIFSRVLESLSKVESFGRAEQDIYRVRDLEARISKKRCERVLRFRFISECWSCWWTKRRKGESNLSLVVGQVGGASYRQVWLLQRWRSFIWNITDIDRREFNTPIILLVDLSFWSSSPLDSLISTNEKLYHKITITITRRREKGKWIAKEYSVVMRLKIHFHPREIISRRRGWRVWRRVYRRSSRVESGALPNSRA